MLRVGRQGWSAKHGGYVLRSVVLRSREYAGNARESCKHVQVQAASISAVQKQVNARMLPELLETDEIKADKKRWLVLTATSSEDAPLSRSLEDRMPLYALERQGHTVLGLHEWCQLILEEGGRNRRMVSSSKLGAFILHNLQSLPAFHDLHPSFRTSPDSMQTRRFVQELVKFFQLLQQQGISPSAYSSFASESKDLQSTDNGLDDAKLAAAYHALSTLLDDQNLTTWDGVVLQTLQEQELLKAVMTEYTDIAVEHLQAMTPAMIDLIADITSAKTIQQLTTFEVESETDQSNGTRLASVLQEKHQIRTTQDLMDDNSSHRPRVEYSAYATPEDEVRGIVKRIKELWDDGKGDDASMVVMCPSFPDVRRVSRSLVQQGIHVEGYGLRGDNHLFDEPRVNTIYSLLVALCYPSDSSYLYNVLRSPSFSFPPSLLSVLMEHESKSSVDLSVVLSKFVKSNGASIKYSSYSNDGRLALGEDVIQDGVQKTSAFLSLIDDLRDKCHQMSVQEIIQTFLDATGGTKELLDPSTSEEEREVVAVADFLREIETAERMVQSNQSPLVVPYLMKLRSAWVPAPLYDSSSVEKSTYPTIRVLPLSMRSMLTVVEKTSTLFLACMKDNKFPGRLSRVTLPLPEALMKAPKPIQNRQQLLNSCDDLLAQALLLPTKRVVVSYADISNGKSKKEQVSRYFQDYFLQDQELIHVPKDIESKDEMDQRCRHFDSYEPSHLSFTQVQEYLRCPHRYYLSRVMKLPTPPNTAMMYGRAVHEGVATFSSMFSLENSDFDQAVDAAFSTFRKTLETDNYLLWGPDQVDTMVQQGESDILSFCTRHRDAHVELVEEPFTVDIDAAGVQLKGVWDRVDRDRKTGKAFIQEFKTSMNGTARGAAAIRKDRLQLKLYMYAYEKVFGQAPHAATVEVIGRQDESLGKANDRIEHEPHLAEEVETMVEDIVKRMRRGEFAPEPQFIECAFCPFASSACPAGRESVDA